MEKTSTDDFKYALITGAASGIGYAFTKLLAKKKHHLILVDLDEKRLKEVKQHLERLFSIHIILIVQDLSTVDAPTIIFNKSRNYPVSVLVNNAGFGLRGKFSETDWATEQQMIQLHIMTLTQLTKLFLEPMITSERGKIINVASLAGFYPGPFMAIYYATKAYVVSFSQAIANELKGTGVTVTVLCPGPTRTNFQRKVGSEQSKLAKWSLLASPSTIAEVGYKAMKKGRLIAIPGKLNQLLVFLNRLVPGAIRVRLVRKLQLMNKAV